MSKSKHYKKYDEDQYYDDEHLPGKKMHQERRRSVKNWKKAWSEHEDDYDDVDLFYNSN